MWLVSVREWAVWDFSLVTRSTCRTSEILRMHWNRADCIKASNPILHQISLNVICSVFFFRSVRGAVDYCMDVSGDMRAQYIFDSTIIHCVKANLRKIRRTGRIQGNRIEAALPCWIPWGMATWFLDYCIKESVTQCLWEKQQVQLWKPVSVLAMLDEIFIFSKHF